MENGTEVYGVIDSIDGNSVNVSFFAKDSDEKGYRGPFANKYQLQQFEGIVSIGREIEFAHIGRKPEEDRFRILY